MITYIRLPIFVLGKWVEYLVSGYQNRLEQIT